MSSRPPRSVLDSRLTVISGKGGTGKSSVAAALALAARAQGHRVAVAEVSPTERIADLLEPGREPVGYAGREVRPGITVLQIDPYAALAEYLGLQWGFRSAVASLLSSRSFRQLMDASPGWRELITLGKVWHLEQMREANGEPTFGRIVVDAPASGHGVTFLDIPRVVASAIRGGPLRREALRVEALVRDPSRTVLLPVGRAEELPVQETVELVSRATEQTGIHVANVVANAVDHEPLPGAMNDLAGRLERAAPESLPPPWPTPATLAICARRLTRRSQRHRHFVAQLAQQTQRPVLVLPFLAAGVRSPADLEKLAAGLAEPEWYAEARP